MEQLFPRFLIEGIEVGHSAWIYCEVPRNNTLLFCTTHHMGWYLCLAL